MNVRRLLVALCWAVALPVSALAQAGAGFAGMGQDPGADFAMPAPDYRLRFPQDHGAHPDFRLEWWYLTANLAGPDGADYGVQWTLFRLAFAPEAPGAVASGWESPQMWMGHAGLTTPDSHFAAERFARGGIGQAGVTPAPFAAWIDDWQMAGLAPPGADGLSHLRLSARGDAFAYELEARAQGPLVAHGAHGFSLKSESGAASHYYSQPFYEMSGWIETPAGRVAVTGQGWLDREWSSRFLEGEQAGWDWFALHLDDGRRLMVAQVRDAAQAPFRFGTLIAQDGAATPLDGADLRLAPLSRAAVAGRDVPVAWRIELPGHGIDIEARAVNPDAWMPLSVQYWEGPVRVSGSHAGRGYLEMTAP